MFTILNRLRGMNGVWSKFNGLLLAYIIYSISHSHYVALGVGILYVIGESWGWGLPVGNLTVHRINTILDDGEGKNNGIQWLTRKLVPNYSSNMMTYCRVFLVIRGFYWWVCLLPLVFFIKWYFVLLAIVLLSLAFPLACEVGYYTSKIWNFKYMDGGWEHQEVFYGLFIDLVLIGVYIWM